MLTIYYLDLAVATAFNMHQTRRKIRVFHFKFKYLALCFLRVCIKATVAPRAYNYPSSLCSSMYIYMHTYGCTVWKRPSRAKTKKKKKRNKHGCWKNRRRHRITYTLFIILYRAYSAFLYFSIYIALTEHEQEQTSLKISHTYYKHIYSSHIRPCKHTTDKFYNTCIQSNSHPFLVVRYRHSFPLFSSFTLLFLSFQRFSFFFFFLVRHSLFRCVRYFVALNQFEWNILVGILESFS